MLLLVTHETRYDYAPPVASGRHMAHLKPLGTATQQLRRHAMHIAPQPAERSESIDVFGNTRSFFAFESRHETLVVRAESLVQTHAPRPICKAQRTMRWETARERFRYRKGIRDDPASEFVYPSTFAPLHDDFVAYARASFSPGRPLHDAALELTRRIHADFVYDSTSTEINTPALQALAQRRGVCQDFSHILIACLRNLGLAARYVSGYMLTQPPPGEARLVGADASHAWVELYLPPVGPSAQGAAGTWTGFCPTNGRQPGEDYVKAAVGRDFADVSPIRGILHGGTHHHLDVAVTVMPFAELDAAQQQQWLATAEPAGYGGASARANRPLQMGQERSQTPGAGQFG